MFSSNMLMAMTVLLVVNIFAGSRGGVRGNDCTTLTASRWKRDGASFCPPKDDIEPCVCNANYNTVTCRDVSDDVKLRLVFGGFSNVRITKVEITNSDILVVSAGVFGKIKMHDIEIRENALTSVEDNAFAGSEFTTLYINFNHNKLEKFSFQSIRSIVKLRQLQLAYNRLTEIPDNAFGNLTKLDFIALNNNQIEKVGKHAFRNLESLSFLDLSHNNLIELGAHTMSFSPKLEKPLSVVLNRNNITNVYINTFEGKTPTFLSLIRNNLKTLQEDIFQPIINSMLDSTTVVGLAVQGNPIVCDCRVKWILNIPVSQMNTTLRQFQCSDGRVPANLTLESLKC